MGAAVLVAVTVAADPATAFRLFTTEIDLWWGRGPRFRLAPRTPGGPQPVMRFEPGPGGRLIAIRDQQAGDVFEIGRILAWEPGRRLIFEWRGANFSAGQVTEVEIRFVAVAEGTRVIVEHRGWDTLPAGHPARHGLPETAFLNLIAAWWDDLLHAFARRSDRWTG